jgi:16S rRNA (uracil1498-N3)-methyltransferase
MNRFYCKSVKLIESKAILSEDTLIHHIRDVLRLKEKEALTIFDQVGIQYIGIIDKILPKEIIVLVQEIIPVCDQRQVKICVACALPKKSKIDDIIDKLTQLGVDRIIPMISERVVIRLPEDKQSFRKARWEKIALAGSQQSQRSTIPEIAPLTDFNQVLALSSGFDLKLIPTLPGNRKPLKEVLTEATPKNILVLIGPEGDFSESEIEAAQKSGFIPISLGEIVLRVETAAVYVASILNY